MRLLFALLLLVAMASAQMNVSLSDQGTGVRYLNGTIVPSADLTIYIYAAGVGGIPIWSQVYTNGIINGSWNVMLYDIPLTMNDVYWKDYEIDSDNIDFDGVDRLNFTSPVGSVDWNDIDGKPAIIGANNISSSNASKEAIFDDMNLLITAYNRITTAPTINAADASVASSMNFPSAATIWGDGGLVVSGTTATASSIIQATKMEEFHIRLKLTNVSYRSDILGTFKTAVTVVQNGSKTGIFFLYNGTNYAAKNWSAVTCDNGVCTVTDTQIPADTNWHTFSIVGNVPEGISTNFTFIIDGTQVANHDTNLPTTQTSTLGTWVENLDAVADVERVDWIYYEVNR